MIPLNIHISVRPRRLIPAQTWSFNGCFGFPISLRPSLDLQGEKSNVQFCEEVVDQCNAILHLYRKTVLFVFKFIIVVDGHIRMQGTRIR